MKDRVQVSTASLSRRMTNSKEPSRLTRWVPKYSCILQAVLKALPLVGWPSGGNYMWATGE
ncbi:MAG: hypothetical protein ACPHJ3_20895, partial [Rubripirellula sp.]